MHILFGIPVLCYCRDWFILSVVLECFALQSCTENWKTQVLKIRGQGEFIQVFHSEGNKGGSFSDCWCITDIRHMYM